MGKGQSMSSCRFTILIFKETRSQRLRILQVLKEQSLQQPSIQCQSDGYLHSQGMPFESNIFEDTVEPTNHSMFRPADHVRPMRGFKFSFQLHPKREFPTCSSVLRLIYNPVIIPKVSLESQGIICQDRTLRFGTEKITE
ncbi:Uncharacterized protein Fot_02072 [Forsythia ovata]|uniref:Ribosomal protein L5 n=1 Tax=Forsythia ovata TaxID=205694 RepID=A0ABD1X8U9_9LAMI